MSHVQIKIIECSAILLTLNFVYLFHFHFPKLHLKLKKYIHYIYIELKAKHWKHQMLRTQRGMFSVKEAGFKRLSLPKIFKRKKNKNIDKIVNENYDFLNFDDKDDDIFK